MCSAFFSAHGLKNEVYPRAFVSCCFGSTDEPSSLLNNILTRPYESTDEPPRHLDQLVYIARKVALYCVV